MYPHAGTTRSLWQQHTRLTQGETLRGALQTDVVVVGAGIAGLTTAWLLRKRGLDVAILDDGRIGSGETERTTAHLSSALDEGYLEIERIHGKDNARLAAQSHSQAIDQIEAIVRELQIDCAFRRIDGYLFGSDDTGDAALDDEYAAAGRAGLEVELVNEVPGLPRVRRALCFRQQGEFEPLQYLGALADACMARGVRLFTGAHVSELEGGDAPKVTTEDGVTINARRAVIVCTNTPVNDLVALHTKQIPYRSYVIGLRVAADTLPSALWWDTAEPYHYVRLVRAADRSGDGHDVLIVGGEDHKVSAVDDGEERFARLEAWARERFACGARISQWSGQVMEPIDGLAFIGKNPMDADNVYVATGDSGHGLTHGTIAGMMFAEMLFADNKHPWAALYDPRRHSPKAIADYAKESVNAVAQFARWFKGSDVAHDEDIKRGSGAVQRRGLSLVAVSVDNDGHRHECTAVCPHLGAILAWNDLEKSWDCPLHGSRFTALGTVINGPANTCLKRFDDDGNEVAGALQQEESSGPVASFADRK